MRQLAKFILLAALMGSLTFSARAQFVYFTNADNTICITGYTGADDSVVIPETIDNLPVSSIGDYAFESVGLKSVVIPKGLESIGFRRLLVAAT